jgi:hypothetical protein
MLGFILSLCYSQGKQKKEKIDFLGEIGRIAVGIAAKLFWGVVAYLIDGIEYQPLNDTSSTLWSGRLWLCSGL